LSENQKVNPIALQYSIPKVQNDLKPPEELKVSGVMPIRDKGHREQSVYPFAIYDSLDDVKESSTDVDKPKRGEGRRSRSTKLSTY